MNALLVLEDGTVFKGQSFGAPGETTGEVVFNTSMTGYQEILTDPSYKGQIVTMTYPLIGNYGINSDDIEARKMFLEGFVVKECSQVASNWRAERSLDEYLRQQNIIGIQGVDTRAITKHIRVAGAMKGIISTKSDDIDTLLNKLKKAPDLVGRDLVKEVTIKEKYNWESQGKGQYKVVLVDCGAKYNIMRELVKRDCEVIVVPAETTAEEILKLQPNGLMLSNGPGDPEAVTYVVKTVKNLLGKVPIFGICLGHQMLGQALGGKTYKLKFGHHGANHPVIDLRTGKIAITVQNHGFVWR